MDWFCDSPNCTPLEATTPNTTHRPINGTLLPHITLLLLQPLSLFCPKFPYRHIILSALLILLTINSHSTRHTPSISHAIPFTFTWILTLSTLEKILFSGSAGPEENFWRKGKPREAKRYRECSLQKLQWAFSLFLSLRGVGWNHQISRIPALNPGYRNKAAFLRSKGVELILNLFLADFAGQVLQRVVFEQGPKNSACINLWEGGLGVVGFKIGAAMANAYFSINGLYLLVSVVAIGSGIGEPKDWPPLFGRISDAYTLKRFWGVFWHQLPRRSFLVYADSVTDWFGLERKSGLAAFFRVYIGFCLSGIFHVLGLLQLPLATNITVKSLCISQCKHTAWHLAALTLEGVIQTIWIATFGTPRADARWPRWVGYAWVLVSYSLAVPFFGHAILRAKIGQQAPLKLSLNTRILDVIIPSLTV